MTKRLQSDLESLILGWIIFEDTVFGGKECNN